MRSRGGGGHKQDGAEGVGVGADDSWDVMWGWCNCRGAGVMGADDLLWATPEGSSEYRCECRQREWGGGGESSPPESSLMSYWSSGFPGLTLLGGTASSVTAATPGPHEDRVATSGVSSGIWHRLLLGGVVYIYTYICIHIHIHICLLVNYVHLFYKPLKKLFFYSL